MTKRHISRIVLQTVAVACAWYAGITGRPHVAHAVSVASPQGSQQSEIILSLSGESGARPRYAVADFLSRTADAGTTEAAKLIASVLWDDLSFEREFYMVPRDTYKSVPQARTLSDIPFDKWRELGVDGLVIGTVEKTSATTFRIEMRLYDVRSRRSAMGREYSGSAGSSRTRPRMTFSSRSARCGAWPGPN
jgi:hypothetical protein